VGVAIGNWQLAIEFQGCKSSKILETGQEKLIQSF
jgi:hypothetical protein